MYDFLLLNIQKGISWSVIVIKLIWSLVVCQFSIDCVRGLQPC